jgi:hypothetical protein
MGKNNFPYPKGSEWRKWDLHVHTKLDSDYSFHSDSSISSKEQNDEEYPKIFIEYLYSVKNLGVIAITDHNKGDWIDKLIDENDRYVSENGKDKITILPGVEIESGDGIHLLVIFNPDTQLENVKRNFRKLTWKETIEHFITATKNPSNPNTFKTTEEIMEEAKNWDAVCIFAHVTSDKGFFRISSGDRKTKIYKYNLTQIFQIPKEDITDNGILNIINGKDPNYGNKSVTKITASDAKGLKDIGTNNCWIKADPTFEGLKQIIYEPEDRVYIGEEPPHKIERNKIIKSITISNSNKWFEDNKPISLNEGLVSIIGGKGTGKTAILDLIAYAAGSYKCYEEDEMKSKSFLKKAFKELKGANIKLEWDDGAPDEIIISDKLEEAVKEGKVRYLPQDFTDQLCSEIGKGELEKQIENVIFQKIPSENRANFTDFKSYKDTQLKVINDKKNRVSEQIAEINLKIHEHNKLIRSKDKIKEEIKKVDSEIERFHNEMEKISDLLKDSKDQKEILNKLNSSIDKRSELEKIISGLNTKLLKIEEIENEIDRFREYSEAFIKRLKNDFREIEITQTEIEKIKLVLYPENLKQILDDRKKEIREEIKKQKTNLDKINKDIKELSDKITVEKSKQDKIKEINKSLSDLKKKKDSLNNDIEKIKEAEKTLTELLDSRRNLFANYFELIFEEKERLKEIYSPLRNILEESGEENEKLFDFTVKFNFDINAMADEGHKLIDLRAEGRFRQSRAEMLRMELEKLRFTLNLDEQKISEEDKESIEKFLEEVRKLFGKDEKEIISQLKKERYTKMDFDNWLFSTKYYSMSYSIKFNGIELNNLSPGLKGVALLILFLELDRDDKRPILIDQPEENLDNRSVYITLMRYFRESKKRRQIIIVTHNPNLVVNADSEQVIVANFDKGLEKQISRISYVSGSLENTFKNDSVNIILEKKGIREHVCEILEGGEEAFKKREDKYQIK